ncbi:MAG: DUF4259 domain-containing protein [Desulfobacula sp.]|nr:DUF4259 domain-containing protein [Desulfobacula sp.]
MGAWNTKPWDNDTAADWFGKLFEETNLKEKIREGLDMDMDLYLETIRAAACILMFLGRRYVFSSGLDDNLSYAIKKMEEIQKHPYYLDNPETGKELKYEIAVLKYHLDMDNKLSATPDFINWWLSLLRESGPFDGHQTGDYLDCFTKKIRIKNS